MLSLHDEKIHGVNEIEVRIARCRLAKSVTRSRVVVMSSIRKGGFDFSNERSPEIAQVRSNLCYQSFDHDASKHNRSRSGPTRARSGAAGNFGVEFLSAET